RGAHGRFRPARSGPLLLPCGSTGPPRRHHTRGSRHYRAAAQGCGRANRRRSFPAGGRPMSDMSCRSLLEIENDALAHQRPGNLFERACEPGCLKNVPLKEALVEIDDLHILAFHAHRAFQPPVWRMQPMCEMAMKEGETTALNGTFKFAFAEDANMAARLVVV